MRSTAALHATVDRRRSSRVRREPARAAPACSSAGDAGISRNARSCGAAVAETEGGLVCRRCGTERPRVCLHCHSTRFARRRPGVTRVREEMAALLSRVTVAEVDAATAGAPAADGARRHRGRAPPRRRGPDRDRAGGVPGVRPGAARDALSSRRAGAVAARSRRPVVGDRGDGRVLVQTRVPDHDVIAGRASPGTRRSSPTPSVPDDASSDSRRSAGWPRSRGAPDAVDVACAALRAVRGLRVFGPDRGGGRRPGRSSRRRLPTCSATRSPRSISPAPRERGACASTWIRSGSDRSS